MQVVVPNMQVVVPGRPQQQCHYWNCSLALTPFCSHDHQALSQVGEQSAAAVVVVDGTTDAHALFVSLKCVRGKLLDHQAHYGLPMLPAAVLETPPWVQPGVFDLNLRPLEATREWVFMTTDLPPGRIGLYWQHYETRNNTAYKRSRWRWYKVAPHQHSGFFRLTLFSVPGSLVGVYWLMYKPVIPGEKGSALQARVPVDKDNPENEGKGEAPSGSKRRKLGKDSDLTQPILGSASNPLQVCLRSQSQQTKGYEEEMKQVIILQEQLAHKSYMKVFCCSYSHYVASKGKFITFVSTDAETELKAGIDLLGPVDEIFFYMCCDNEPASDNCTRYDATTHSETTVTDVLTMCTLITGMKVLHMINLSHVLLSEMMPKLLSSTVAASAAEH
ncbi:hypothetical protein DY000_02032772 [Brassica cretica]|uniref:Uncharacterized protein n=1 Tax=Brassica cretica TaxID=69181 RepID=A0ABQ7DIL2_BRACR|nr:hypothetical protein DY000_02032772 [Brassica cretica]